MTHLSRVFCETIRYAISKYIYNERQKYGNHFFHRISMIDLILPPTFFPFYERMSYCSIRPPERLPIRIEWKRKAYFLHVRKIKAIDRGYSASFWRYRGSSRCYCPDSPRRRSSARFSAVSRSLSSAGEVRNRIWLEGNELKGKAPLPRARDAPGKKAGENSIPSLASNRTYPRIILFLTNFLV